MPSVASVRVGLSDEKILYLDENGKYRSYQPEPVDITVRELGIKSWLQRCTVS